MNKDKLRAYLTRDEILNTLSDQEVANVCTAETAERLAVGDEYLDLGHLEQGVRRAAETATPMGRVLPRKAVQEATWGKLLAQMVASGGGRARQGV